MNDSSLIIYLVLATFGVAISIGIYQLFRVRNARKKHHHSARTPDEVANNR